MKKEIDRDRFVTISELTKLLDFGVTSSAVRRNINKYPEYFNSEFVRGVQYVEKDSGLKVYRIIDGALRPGRNRGGLDVLDALKAAGIEPVPQTQSESEISVKHETSGTDVVKVLSEIKDVMTEIKDALKKGG